MRLCRYFGFLSLFLVLLLSSCTESSTQAASSSQIERPDMEFSTVTYSLGQSEFPPVIMTASSMQIYEDEGVAILNDVSFIQKNSEKLIIMQGSCDDAKVNTRTYSAVLGGEVSIQRPDDGLAIKGSDITWDNDLQRISTDKSFILLYDSDSEIQGIGLTCDFRTSTYEFDTITEGRLAP
ncbi:MAG: LPS export ABC transporter periplasmic protein LptC [Spirochaetales bacterium]|nr:LPS export ABC transporter periplasmic protein LptC [Spirochaetales bacterium]